MYGECESSIYVSGREAAHVPWDGEDETADGPVAGRARSNTGRGSSTDLDNSKHID